jgi:hypothetical protein
MRAEFWQATPSNHVAVGYRFLVRDQFSEPTMAIDAARYDESRESVLPTEFTNRTGGDCGSLKIRFLSTPSPTPPGYLAFLIDDPDLAGLLRLISSCAAQ